LKDIIVSSAFAKGYTHCNTEITMQLWIHNKYVPYDIIICL